MTTSPPTSAAPMRGPAPREPAGDGGSVGHAANAAFAVLARELPVLLGSSVRPRVAPPPLHQVSKSCP